MEKFANIASCDHLHFDFGSRSYQQQLDASISKCGTVSAVRIFENESHVMVEHDFGFMGGSLGCAEGEKITKAFELAIDKGKGVVVVSRSGGARMQEGTSSLMQMAKVSVAVNALRSKHLPFISILTDPTFGGVPASYAMQGDVRIVIEGARVGFAGPAVILNTMFKGDQKQYDLQQPNDFQKSSYLWECGQVDMEVPTLEDAKRTAIDIVELVLSAKRSSPSTTGTQQSTASPQPDSSTSVNTSDDNLDFRRSRDIDRFQTQDAFSDLLDSYHMLSGDGRISRDVCLKGGIGTFQNKSVIVLGCFKGHSPAELEESNHGMPSPHGYRFASRLFDLAASWDLPVISFIDTCGAFPTFEAERFGQSEAIATCLTKMAALPSPMITVVLGEGGSGGALGIGMGNTIGMFENAYYSVISPEGAASILGRYKNEDEKRARFNSDCDKLAKMQRIFAKDLLKLDVIDEILSDNDSESVRRFISQSLDQFCPLSPSAIVEHRYQRFRKIGTFESLTADELDARLQTSVPPFVREKKEEAALPREILYAVDSTMKSETSSYRNLGGISPRRMSESDISPPPTQSATRPVTAKTILDACKVKELAGDAVSEYIRSHSKTRTFFTDTTLRDAHQSLLATRFRTKDIVALAEKAQASFAETAFSLECWGGATFDVSMRFLKEDPWERLRQIRKACPNTLTQMLLRGENTVGYTNYPPNVIRQFVHLAAKNGVDVFRVFDCFNDVDKMKVCCESVRKEGKIAEVCLCYTEDILTSDKFNAQYYKEMTRKVMLLKPHIIGIKDMAGLLKVSGVSTLLAAIRSETSLPIHFHTHDTSAAQIATLVEMVKYGCDIVDVATASLANATSQPSMGALVSALEGTDRPTGISHHDIEEYDKLTKLIRKEYFAFENGMKGGTARVYHHEIPGGQYSNLLFQAQAMNMGEEEFARTCDAYHDVNKWFGRIVKVTPSSKVVGDLAILLTSRGLSVKDIDGGKVDLPDSVINMLKGSLGVPYGGFPEVILESMGIESGTWNGAAKDVDIEGKRRYLETTFPTTEYGIEFDDERVMSYILYPPVFEDYLKFHKEFGTVEILPTCVFWHGLEVGNLVLGYRLERIGGVFDGKRKFEFVEEATNLKGSVTVDDPKCGADDEGFQGQMVEKGNEEFEIGSPIPGIVVQVNKKDVYEENDDLVVIEAMKMQVSVKASVKGVYKIVLNEGEKVIEHALVAVRDR